MDNQNNNQYGQQPGSNQYGQPTAEPYQQPQPINQNPTSYDPNQTPTQQAPTLMTPQVPTPQLKTNQFPPNPMNPSPGQAPPATVQQNISPTMMPQLEQVTPPSTTTGYGTTASPTVPALGSAQLDSPKPGITFGILSIIFSLSIVLSLLGFILGIVSIVKGFKRPNSNLALGVMGIIGVILSILVSILAILLAIPALLGQVDYSEMKTYSGSNDNGSYSFSYPEQMVMDNSNTDDRVVMLKHEIDGEETLSAAYFLTESAEGLGTSTEFRQFYLDEEGQKKIKEVHLTMASRFAGAEDVEISNTVSLSNSKMEGAYHDISYKTDKTASKETITIKGQIITVYSSDTSNVYTMVILAEENIWNLNTETWQQMKDSIDG